MYCNGMYNPAHPPHSGLALARQIAMITYRTHDVYQERYGRKLHENSNQFSVQSYLDYQGKKFLSRFDAQSYIYVTKTMDTHDVSRGRGDSLADAMKQLHHMPVVIMGIDSDVLYPLREQEELHALLPQSEFHVIRSPHGHDGFLLEQEAVENALTAFLG